MFAFAFAASAAGGPGLLPPFLPPFALLGGVFRRELLLLFLAFARNDTKGVLFGVREGDFVSPVTGAASLGCLTTVFVVMHDAWTTLVFIAPLREGEFGLCGDA